jgi:hypothetical protein
MTIAGKINFLFIVSGLFLISIATGYVAQREYEVTLDDLVGKAQVRTHNRPELQFYLYREDKRGLEQILDNFLDSQAITGAVAYSSLSETLSSRNINGAAPGDAPSLASIRAESAISDTNLVALMNITISLEPVFGRR